MPASSPSRWSSPRGRSPRYLIAAEGAPGCPPERLLARAGASCPTRIGRCHPGRLAVRWNPGAVRLGLLDRARPRGRRSGLQFHRLGQLALVPDRAASGRGLRPRMASPGGGDVSRSGLRRGRRPATPRGGDPHIQPSPDGTAPRRHVSRSPRSRGPHLAAVVPRLHDRSRSAAGRWSLLRARSGGLGGSWRTAASAPVIALHESRHRLARSLPLGLIAED